MSLIEAPRERTLLREPALSPGLVVKVKRLAPEPRSQKGGERTNAK